MEAAFSQSTWNSDKQISADSADTITRYLENKPEALKRYLLYWRHYCLDMQLVRSLLFTLKPQLHPLGQVRCLNTLKRWAVDLLSLEVNHELSHFRRLEDLTREEQHVFRDTCQVISLVYLFEAQHMRHDSFRKTDFPQLPKLQSTGPYCYHHQVRLDSLQGEMASVKVRSEVVSENNVLDLYTELKAWEQLKQEGFPGVAHLYGTMTLNGRFAFVYEACDGSLNDLLQIDTNLAPHLQTTPAVRLRALQQLCRFARQLFSVTFFLHRRSFVHRDLDLRTIFYTHSDWTYELKVCNFTVSGTNTDIFDTITNLSWYDTAMHGQKLDLSPALDMCNLGLVLWALYHGQEAPARPMRSEQCLIPDFESFDGPAPLRDLIRRCTSRDEACRPTEAEEGDILRILRSRDALGESRRMEGSS